MSAPAQAPLPSSVKIFGGLFANGDVTEVTELSPGSGSIARQELPAGMVRLWMVGSLYPTQGHDAQYALDRYLDQGLKGLQSLRGAFVVIVSDACSGQLHLMRDALGERVLYYMQTPRGLAFCDHLLGLREHLGPDPVCRIGLSYYLACGYVPEDGTVLAAVKKLRPGEQLTSDGTEHRTKRTRYFAPTEATTLAQDYESAVVELRALLELAVVERLSGAPECGLFLSGGLDSSLVAALAVRHRPGIRTYSLDFGPEYPGERYYSDLVAKHCGTTHERVVIGGEDMIALLPEVVAAIGEPIGDPITVPNFLLARRAGSDARQILNGEGGDPLFGGPKNIPLLLEARFNKDLAPAYYRSYRKLFAHLPQLVRGYDTHLAERLLSDARRYLDDPETRFLLNRMMRINTIWKGAGNILIKVGATYRAGGVTALSPLFDDRITRAAFRYPPAWKLAGRREKAILKDAVKGLLPEEVIEREKSGMRVPVSPWSRAELAAAFAIVLGPERLEAHGLFDIDFVQNLLGSSGIQGRPSKLWSLFYFQIWYDVVVGRRSDPAQLLGRP